MVICEEYEVDGGTIKKGIIVMVERVPFESFYDNGVELKSHEEG